MSDMRRTGFQMELTVLINKYSMENYSDTPDFILAKFVENSMIAFESATKMREKWYGRDDKETVDVNKAKKTGSTKAERVETAVGKTPSKVVWSCDDWKDYALGKKRPSEEQYDYTYEVAGNVGKPGQKITGVIIGGTKFLGKTKSPATKSGRRSRESATKASVQGKRGHRTSS